MKMCSLILATMLTLSCHVNTIKPVKIESTGESCIGIDENGDGWVWDETNVKVGDECILLMDDKGTEDKADDEIKIVITHDHVYVF